MLPFTKKKRIQLNHFLILPIIVITNFLYTQPNLNPDFETPYGNKDL